MWILIFDNVICNHTRSIHEIIDDRKLALTRYKLLLNNPYTDNVRLFKVEKEIKIGGGERHGNNPRRINKSKARNNEV